MKIKFLGTAAAEGIPALFCTCNVCEKARTLKGREIRRRCSVLINENMLIDLGPDSLWNMVEFGVRYEQIEYILFSHSHFDHMCVSSLLLAIRKYRRNIGNRKIVLVGSEHVYKRIKYLVEFYYKEHKNFEEIFSYKIVCPYETLALGNYHISILPSNHDKNEQCLLYIVSNNGKTLFYNTDTKPYDIKLVFNNIEIYRFDVVLSDCTYCSCNEKSGRHMSVMDNIKMKNDLYSSGYITKKTYYVLTHFSHDSLVSYDDFLQISLNNNMLLAYDGMEIKI